MSVLAFKHGARVLYGKNEGKSSPRQQKKHAGDLMRFLMTALSMWLLKKEPPVPFAGLRRDNSAVKRLENGGVEKRDQVHLTDGQMGAEEVKRWSCARSGAH